VDLGKNGFALAGCTAITDMVQSVSRCRNECWLDMRRPWN